jgi:hypothetical protein
MAPALPSGHAPAPARPWWLGLAAFLVWLVTRLLLATLRVRRTGEEHLAAARARGRPLIYCFWHGRQLALFGANPERGAARPVTVLTSFSRDGELQARVCRRFGLGVVRGSSSRSGLAGMLALTRALEAGHPVGLAIDGPRGPAEEAKSGALALARATGALLVPITAACRQSRALARAWDRFELPVPFTRVEVRLGPLLEVSRTAGRQALEALRLELGQRLRALTREAELAVGREPASREPGSV